MHLHWLRLLALGALVAAQPVSAQNTEGSTGTAAGAAEDRTDEAKGLFAAGKAAFDAGRFADALDYFRRSYQISGRAALLYNIALSHDRLREDGRALEAYEQYLKQAPEAPNRAEVETRLAAIRAALANSEPAPSQTAPAPAEVAAAALTPEARPIAAADGAPPRDRSAEDGGLLTKWGFWTGVGVVVAGGVTAALIAASGGEDAATPIEPGTGVLVTTLRSAP